ncbi:MAG: iron ABC transporter permease [Deltaproteobacteria bacterium]|nr:iron ABC transporter permease [Deltaproteobacteria bacterium]
MPPSPQKRFRHRLLLVGLGVLLACLIVGAAGLGFIHITPGQVSRIIAWRLGASPDLVGGLDPLFRQVVLEVRLPRILTAAVVGGGLALAGVVFQGILLNPLADPFTLGVSSGAAFGAAVSLWLGLNFLGPYTVGLLAFLGAVVTLLVVLALSTVRGQTSPNHLILSGVIVAAILSAGISFIKYLADEQVSVIIFWLMGSFVSKTWVDLGLTLAVTSLGFLVCLFYARDLNILSLGNRSAQALGVETKKVRLTLLITASLVSAVCVSVSGIIGFVGLLIPHLMRFLVGPDNRLLLPASALAGALLLLAADTVTRAALPHEVPIGVLTALIGGPFFCYVFRLKQLGRSHA